MDTIYADYSVSMSEFKKNPAQVLRTAGEKPVAVLNHNRPAFYMITPKLFEALVEELSDRDLAELARQRLANKDGAVEVDIDSL
ncbi:type II toxin-antitoxin system prevent-host-death family antitoxin [Castellaniella sp.]|uniref:type II toxin-antitoxin system prevent-host-death family antitoxin n=1 Tax=Castellaniella sp. TaxID=1955812 RepID=UPI002D7E92C6|nr:type II toxin-antitoxin system prevent-host-death family antitoxin [Castellaniella sp.]HET8703209.1 type II toxin-antitoxin system prevent-host-death family antitoxin [Castellaniella sp.]